MEYAPNVPLKGVAFTYLAPSAKSDDAAALRMASVILSQGRSSRLYQSLVYQQQLAVSANAGADLREDAGMFTFTSFAANGKKPEDVEAALRAEIKKLQDAPVTAAELEKAKNQIVTGQLQQRETSLGKSQALGRAAVVLGDPNRVNTDLDRLQAVTAADIQRVAQKYFTDNNRYVIYYLPESERPKTSDNKPSMNSSRGGESR
jgi:zinc protease